MCTSLPMCLCGFPNLTWHMGSLSIRVQDGEVPYHKRPPLCPSTPHPGVPSVECLLFAWGLLCFIITGKYL